MKALFVDFLSIVAGFVFLIAMLALAPLWLFLIVFNYLTDDNDTNYSG
jgi:hypothetical protein